MSLGSGSSISESSCDAVISTRPGCIIASSTARIDFSRSIDRVMRVRGNTTILFNATRGYGTAIEVSILLSWRSCSLTGSAFIGRYLAYLLIASLPTMLKHLSTARQTERNVSRLYKNTSIKTDEPALCRLIFRIRCCALTACNQQWFMVRANHIGVDNDLFHIRARWDFIHYVKQHIFNDAAQSARAGALFKRTFGGSVESIVGEDQFYAVKLQELLILLDDSIFGLSQDTYQGILIQAVQRYRHRQATHKLWDQSKFEQVIGDEMRQNGTFCFLIDLFLCLEAHHLIAAQALLDDLVKSFEGPATNEQDVGGIDLDEILVRVLAPTLGRHVGNRAFDDLEQRLLYAFAGDIACDRGIVGLARDLVDLVDIDDAAFGARNIKIGGLDQAQQDVFNILTNVTRLRESGSIGDTEWHFEN